MHPALLALVMLILEVIQTTWLQVPAFSWIQVNLCFVLLLYISFFRGPISGLLFGILIGFTLDINTGTFIGGEIFTYGVIGYFAGSFFRMFLNRYLVLFAVTLMVFSFIQVFLEFGIHQLFTAPSLVQGFSSRDIAPLVTISIRYVIFNGFFSLLMYPFAARWLQVRKRRVILEEDA